MTAANITPEQRALAAGIAGAVGMEQPSSLLAEVAKLKAQRDDLLEALRLSRSILRGLSFEDSKITAALEAISRLGVDESDPLVPQLLGRAEFLRNRGEIKSPELMESAAAAIARATGGGV